MFNEALDELIQEEIDRKVKQYEDEFYSTKQELGKYKEYYRQKLEENNELIKLKKQLKEFEVFKGLINKDNFGEFISHFNLKQDNVDLQGMHSEEVPEHFKLLVTYYRDKDRLFTLMDMFDIEYPFWLRSFRLPQDYNEDELDLIFDHIGKMYVCNSCIFKGNIGFYYQTHRRYAGDLKEAFTKESYVEIPWNLFLKNPLLTTDKYFSKIVDLLKNGRRHSEYFFRIQDYQELTEEQVYEMSKYLPKKRIWDEHNFFIKHNKNLFKIRPDIAAEFKSKISDNQYSTFYYLNYPKEMQAEFIMNYSDRYHHAFDLVSKMGITKEEKLKLLGGFAEKML
jgi:hypothetical protein